MRYVVAIFTVSALLGCSSPVPVQSTPAPTCQSTGATLADEKTDKSEDDVDAAEADDVVTFYGDLLPILDADEGTTVHKCTTCHAHYAKPEGLNSVREVESVVESMRNGRMPRVGTRVPNEQIELFNKWRLQGFKVGVPKPKVKPEGLEAKNTGTGCTP